MKEALIVGGAGALVGGLLALLLLKRKADEVEGRAEALVAVARGGAIASRDYALSTQIRAGVASLTAEAEAEVTRLARTPAQQELGSTYGLTPARLQKLERLGRTLGVG
jgi:uncharacterized membrane protein YebE (DUF533 family)